MMISIAAKPDWNDRAVANKLEDVLGYLPRRDLVEYRKKQIIYDEDVRCDGISLIVSGRVTLTRTCDGPQMVVLAILAAGEFFGEHALLGEDESGRERASALEITTLMSWSRTEVETLIERKPRMGVALIQILVQHCLDFQDRLQSLSKETAPERLAWTLIRFARLEKREPNGAVRIPPLSHQLLAGYICTSRRIVTLHMTQWRRQGLICYSRNATEIYPEALIRYLGLRTPRG
jgi:CRP/FNR family transcriptional regulator, cyclic AMP receptor protein